MRRAWEELLMLACAVAACWVTGAVTYGTMVWVLGPLASSNYCVIECPQPSKLALSLYMYFLPVLIYVLPVLGGLLAYSLVGRLLEQRNVSEA